MSLTNYNNLVLSYPADKMLKFFGSCLVVGIKRAYIVCSRKTIPHFANNPLFPKRTKKTCSCYTFHENSITKWKHSAFE